MHCDIIKLSLTLILYQLDSPIGSVCILEPGWPPLKFLFGRGLFLPRPIVLCHVLSLSLGTTTCLICLLLLLLLPVIGISSSSKVASNALRGISLLGLCVLKETRGLVPS